MSSASVPVLVRLPQWRARFALVLLLACFAVLAGRSAYLQSMKTGFLQEKGEARYARVLEVPGTRGRIVDRNGEALAISTPVRSVWAIPEDFSATPGQLRALAGLLAQDPRELEREQDRSRALEIEYGQLQLESSTWGLHSRVERIATGALGMRAPDPRRVKIVEGGR